MKALLIVDDQNVIDEISDYLKQKNYEVIIYHWLLKAMDNIEEIAPDLIIINAVEYPRHWKALSQYCLSGILKIIPSIYIIPGKILSEIELNKTKILGVKIYNKDEINKEEDLDSYQFVFTNKNIKRIVTGKVLSYSNNILTLEPDFNNLLKGLGSGSIINNATLKIKQSYYDINVEIITIDKELQFKIQDKKLHVK